MRVDKNFPNLDGLTPNPLYSSLGNTIQPGEIGVTGFGVFEDNGTTGITLNGIDNNASGVNITRASVIDYNTNHVLEVADKSALYGARIALRTIDISQPFIFRLVAQFTTGETLHAIINNQVENILAENQETMLTQNFDNINH